MVFGKMVGCPWWAGLLASLFALLPNHEATKTVMASEDKLKVCLPDLTSRIGLFSYGSRRFRSPLYAALLLLLLLLRLFFIVPEIAGDGLYRWLCRAGLKIDGCWRSSPQRVRVSTRGAVDPNLLQRGLSLSAFAFPSVRAGLLVAPTDFLCTERVVALEFEVL